MTVVAAAREQATRPRDEGPSPSTALRAVVRRGLRDRRRAPLTWGLPLGAVCGLIVAMYPSIEDSLAELTDSYPQGLKDAFGIEELTSVEAYLDAEMFSLIVPLAISFFAVRSIAWSVSVAEERGYLDTTLAAPLSRRALVAGSYVATAVATAAVLFVVFAVTVLVGAATGVDISALKVAAGTAGVWPLAMFFAGVATLVAGRTHRSSTVTAVSAGTLVGMYVVDLVGKLAEPAEPFRVLSAFKYYGSGLTDGLDLGGCAALTVCGVLLAAVGTLLFERRDVRA